MNSSISSSSSGFELDMSDDGELARVVDEYLTALEAGNLVDIESLAAAHPAIALRLRACLSVLHLATGMEVRVDLDGGAYGAANIELNDFQIIRQIGRGGMGIVFEALQLSLRRRVALKILPFAAAFDPRQQRRFEIEARAAAQLHHTNIVPVFAVGCERGIHYYAMQYIEGQSLADTTKDLREPPGPLRSSAADATRVRDGQSPIRAELRELERESPCSGLVSKRTGQSGDSQPIKRDLCRIVAGLGLQAAEALAHAHKLGIIHRDIKPANLLVDTRGNLWITDFGLARIENETNVTSAGDILGTKRYMSPEQSSGDHATVDGRTDIYSLGATLFELLTRRPFQSASSPHDPPDQSGFRELKSLRVPRDLRTIVFKALAPGLDDRYRSAGEMAEDLRRFLDGRTILARRPGILKRTIHWAQRNKRTVGIAIAVSIVATAAIGFIAGLTWERRSLLAQARQQLYVHDVANASRLVRNNHLREASALLARHVPATGESDYRSFPWHYLWRICHYQTRAFQGHVGDVYHLEFSPDGKSLASAGQDGTIRIWNIVTGKSVRTFRGHEGDVNWVSFSHDGKLIASAGDDGTVRIWTTSEEDPSIVLGKHTRESVAVAFSPDGNKVISAGRDGIVAHWDVIGRRKVSSINAHSDIIESMSLSRDGKIFATSSRDKTVRVWNASSTLLIEHKGEHAFTSVFVGSDNKTLFAGNADRSVRLWNDALKAPSASLTHSSSVQGVAISPDGRTIASCGDDGEVRLFDAKFHTLRKSFRGFEHRLWSVAFSPDGGTLAACGADGTIRAWSLAEAQDRETLQLPFVPISLLPPMRGHRLGPVINSEVPGLLQFTFWDMTRSRPVLERSFDYGSGAWRCTMDGTRIIGFADETSWIIWNSERTDVRGPVSMISLPALPDATSEGWILLTSPDDRRILVRANGGPGLYAIGLADRSILRSPNVQWRTHVSWSPDSEAIAGFTDSRLIIWTVGSEKLEVSREEPGRWPSSVEFSPDGKSLVTSDGDGKVHVWDRASMKRTAILIGHDDAVQHAVFSPDGRVVAVASNDRTISFWDIATKDRLLVLEGHSFPVRHLAFSPDGSRLFSAAYPPDWQGYEFITWPAVDVEEHEPRESPDRSLSRAK